MSASEKDDSSRSPPLPTSPQLPTDTLDQRQQAELQSIHQLLWGDAVREDIFRRWSQGFEFSEHEHTALVQREGGPCAVIAPVQAYLLKAIMTDEQQQPGIKDVKEIDGTKAKTYLINALCNILESCAQTRYRLAYLATQTAADSGQFIAALSHRLFNTIAELKLYLGQHIDAMLSPYGVLLFLYSVLLTKGYDQVMQELSDNAQTLIDSVFGYGAQALINLMLTGRAVSNVFDNVQNVGGMQLQGIDKQSEVGFITLLESLQFLEVGSFYKNPRYPIWVMGSDTHLSVVFSFEQRLVSPETPAEIAIRVFKAFDTGDGTFIATEMLQDALAQLGLVTDEEYVSLMQKRLDPDGLGIILLNAFMEEFYPNAQRSLPDSFNLYHYNGIPGSNPENQVRFHSGCAILLEDYLKSVNEGDQLLSCLKTKWKSIDVEWTDYMPQLN